MTELESFLPKQSISGPRCMILQGSTECPLQNGYIISTMQEYLDTKQFDEFVKSRRNINIEYIRKFQSDYTCPEFQGQGQQFHSSIFCAMLTTKPSFCTSESTVPTIPLCKDTCRQGTAALLNVFSNTCQIKTPDSLFIRNQTITQYQSFCDGLSVQNNRFGSCLDGSRQPIELNQCGFGTLAEAQTFCNSINGANSCCSLVDRNTVPSALPTVQPDCARNPKLCPQRGVQVSDGVLYTIIVIGIILFLAVIVFCYRWLGKKPTMPTNEKPYLSVISNYEGKMVDELTLYVGDKVQMYETFDDGWAYGRHLGTNRQGTFPLVCTVLAPLE